MLLLWFAWTGFMLGFGSIYLMQQVVSDTFGQLVGWAFAIGSIGLTSYGIYLGRFLRWNSWDVLRNPSPFRGYRLPLPPSDCSFPYPCVLAAAGAVPDVCLRDVHHAARAPAETTGPVTFDVV